jgi:hypothetical protein
MVGRWAATIALRAGIGAGAVPGGEPFASQAALKVGFIIAVARISSRVLGRELPAVSIVMEGFRDWVNKTNRHLSAL